MAYNQRPVTLVKSIYGVCKFHRFILHRLPVSQTPGIWAFKKTSQQHFSAQSTGPSAGENKANAEFKVIYRFPYIRTARLISRMKLYQTGFTVLLIPPMCYAYATGMTSLTACVSTICVGTFASIMLLIMSNYFQRLIGLIAVSDKEPYVRLSHLTFLGNRRDVFVPCEDIVPLSDISENVNDIYLKVRRYSNKDVFYLSLQFGKIEDEHELQKVLGRFSKQ